MNVLILEDEQRNFNRLRRQLEEIDTTFHVEGPLANIQESVEWLRTPSDSGSYTCGHTPVRWTKF